MRVQECKLTEYMASKQEGVGMVEAIVAMAILAVVSAAVVLLVLQLLVLTFSSRLKNQATSFAEQAVEQARGYYQANGWVALANKGKNDPLCYSAVWTQYLPVSDCVVQCTITGLLIPGTNFYRYSTVTTTGNASVQVSTVVAWNDRGVCKSTQLDTYFYNF